MAKCVVCNLVANPIFFCDIDPGQWCGPCFDLLVRCEEEHGEGCMTIYWSDDAETE